MSEVSNICLSGNNSTQQSTAQPSEMGIQVFTSSLFGNIRTAGTSDTPLFCASDICKALGYSNGRKAVADHVDTEDVTKRYTLTEGGNQLITFVNESGLYALILGSKLKQAKVFKKWITSEVLPSIRKHGAYATQTTIESIIANISHTTFFLTFSLSIQNNFLPLQMLTDDDVFVTQGQRLIAHI